MPENSNELNLDSVVARFQSDLSQCGPENTYSLPEVSNRINHNLKYVQVAEDLAPGIYLDTGLHRPDMNYGFFLQPGNRLTREDSHNKVFFGNMLLLPEGDGGEIHTQVAVKSRVSSETPKLLGEMALFQHLNEIGLRTYASAGLIVGEHATHYMTYFEGNVATMDTADWDEMHPDEAWREVDKVVDTMHQLHTNALFHGDLEFRNVAFDETGRTVIIDPELMTSARDYYEELIGADLLKQENQQKMTRLTNKMSSEFSNVFRSIDKHILPLLPKKQRPRTDEARLKQYKLHLFDPYRARLRDTDSDIGKFLLNLTDTVLIKKKQQAKEQIL